jgi:NAD(P)-dependent dehydrogenase (short-subunit alcohol dehydrogenase family)
MRSFSGKVAAITGAASGMGRSLAIALARRGCEVALSDIDEVALAETARLVRSASQVRVTTRRLDVSDEAAMKSWAQYVASEHGRCNLIFNNAGVSYAATVEGGDPADFARIIDIDYWGVVYGTRAFLPYLRASGDGHVINTSSVFGLIAFPGQSAYNSAKAAVRGFTEALRIELEMSGAPVSATCVYPGGIRTNIARASKMHPSMADLGIGDLEQMRKNFEVRLRLSPDDAAEIILRGVQRNALRVLVGFDARMIDWVQRLLPDRYHSVLVRLSWKVLKRQKPTPATASPPPPPSPPAKRPISTAN